MTDHRELDGAALHVLKHLRFLAQLTTWEVSGPHLGRLSQQLQDLPGIEQVAAFGNKLHVSGREVAAIQRAISPFQKEPYAWQKIEPGLEDAFIGLMQTSRDNFQ